MIELRRLEPHETEPLRELRLRALRDAPGAFAETYEEARARRADDWASWVEDPSRVIVVAVDGDEWVGMVACRERGERRTWLTALWVDPAARGAGLGARLVEAVADWSRDRGATELALSVTTNNEAATAFYARAGFVPTGKVRPLPADPSRTEVFLSRPVRP